MSLSKPHVLKKLHEDLVSDSSLFGDGVILLLLAPYLFIC